MSSPSVEHQSTADLQDVHPHLFGVIASTRHSSHMQRRKVRASPPSSHRLSHSPGSRPMADLSLLAPYVGRPLMVPSPAIPANAPARAVTRHLMAFLFVVATVSPVWAQGSNPIDRCQAEAGRELQGQTAAHQVAYCRSIYGRVGTGEWDGQVPATPPYVQSPGCRVEPGRPLAGECLGPGTLRRALREASPASEVKAAAAQN